MRTIFYFILLLIIFVTPANAQQDSTQLPLSKTEIVIVDGISAQELFKRAELWVVKAFKNPNRVIKLSRPDDNEIMLAPECSFYYSKLLGSAGLSVPLTYVIKINTRDGRYRVEITEFFHPVRSAGFGFITHSTQAPDTGHGNAKITRKWEQDVWDELRGTVMKEIDWVSQSLKSTMTSKDQADSDNW